MNNIIDNSIALLSKSSFITQNRFIVKINSKNISFEPYEIDLFNERDKKRINVDIRCTIENLKMIEKLINCKHTALSKFLIKQSNKFNIELCLIDGKLETCCSINYNKCVLRSIKYSELRYNSDSLMVIHCEFEYTNKENQFFEINNDELTTEEKNKINKIIDNENLLLDEALKGARNHYYKNINNENKTIDKHKHFNNLKNVENLIIGAKFSNDSKRFSNIEFEK